MENNESVAYLKSLENLDDAAIMIKLAKNLGSKLKDITGETFGKWKVLGYFEHKKWVCRCSCNKIALVLGSQLRSGRSTSCGHITNAIPINPGDVFGEWEIVEKISSTPTKYLCKCSCGTERVVAAYDLRHGNSKSCGHNTTGFKDMTGEIHGEWTVISRASNNKWKCQCTCKNIGYIKRADLISGASKSCGHATKHSEDITENVYESLTVIGKASEDEKWRCKCECNTVKDVRLAELVNGDTKSCGCKRSEYARENMLERYGETCSCKIEEPRTHEQIEMITIRENLIKAIQENFKNKKPSIYDMESLLGLKYNRINKLIHEFHLEDSIDLTELSSKYESEIVSYIESLNLNITIERNNREILGGKELDIYIPEKKIAIEFNGTYWHSHKFTGKIYHQDKTIECIKRGIRLVHIFEYEWNSETQREKLKALIANILDSEKRVIYARKCRVAEIGSRECTEFTDDYHLQGSVNSPIRYGIYLEDELIGVITFGKPRYSKECEYELIRLAWKSGVNVVGGAERLFKRFIKDHKPSNIVSYCNIAKFSGSVYWKLGFTATRQSLTEPNYVWVSPSTNDIKKRYQTMKHKLLELNIGSPDMTENQIMESIGYLKVYDSGNMKFVWTYAE